MQTETSKNRQQKKPLLTGENVNQLLGAILNQHGTQEQGRNLRKDWRASVEGEFRLTPTQRQSLHNIPMQEVEKIQQAFNSALDHGAGTIQLVLGSEATAAASTQPSGALTITPQQASTAAIVPDFTIPFLRCSFYADCSNWSCQWGPQVP